MRMRLVSERSFAGGMAPFRRQAGLTVFFVRIKKFAADLGFRKVTEAAMAEFSQLRLTLAYITTSVINLKNKPVLCFSDAKLMIAGGVRTREARPKIVEKRRGERAKWSECVAWNRDCSKLARRTSE